MILLSVIAMIAERVVAVAATLTAHVLVEVDAECIRVTTNDADAVVLMGETLVAERDYWTCPVTEGVAWK